MDVYEEVKLMIEEERKEKPWGYALTTDQLDMLKADAPMMTVNTDCRLMCVCPKCDKEFERPFTESGDLK